MKNIKVECLVEFKASDYHEDNFIVNLDKEAIEDLALDLNTSYKDIKDLKNDIECWIEDNFDTLISDFDTSICDIHDEVHTIEVNAVNIESLLKKFEYLIKK